MHIQRECGILFSSSWTPRVGTVSVARRASGTLTVLSTVFDATSKHPCSIPWVGARIFQIL